WGKEFLEELCNMQQETRVRGEEIDDELDDTLLAKAFDKPLNETSVTALEFFLVQKCLWEECTHSTAMAICAAFASYWDNMDGTCFAGEYSCNKSNGVERGCPAQALSIKSLLKTVKVKGHADGHDRAHAEAMLIEELAKVMDWSKTQFLSHMLGQVFNNPKIQFLVTRHGLMRAFMSTSFTLWTR
ncbi:hypothetical protein APHAL10511_007752, partial [Amanita phalloides]